MILLGTYRQLAITPDKIFFNQKMLIFSEVREEYLVIIVGYFFLFLHKNICCGYSLGASCRGASNEYPQHMFLWRTRENYPIIIIKYSSLTSPLILFRPEDTY